MCFGKYRGRKQHNNILKRKGEYMSIKIVNRDGIKVALVNNKSELGFFGVAVLAGSIYETPANAGVSHFAEHMAFKGTSSRNWEQLNRDFGRLGMMPNAFTGADEVMYHATFPKDSGEKAIEIILDMFFNSTYPEEEVEKERNVIAREKDMYGDDPQSVFVEKIDNTFLQWNRGHSALGGYENIRTLSRNDITKFLAENTSLTENVVFIYSGSKSELDIVETVINNIPKDHKYFKKLDRIKLPRNMWSDYIMGVNDSANFVFENDKATTSYVMMLVEGPNRLSNLSAPLAVACSALGGGMYSKLFSRVREELGLCYGIHAFHQTIHYPAESVCAISSITTEANLDLMIEETDKIILDMISNGIDDDLFDCAKNTRLSAFLSGTESSSSKAVLLSKKLLIGENTSIEKEIKKIKKVTKKQAMEAFESVFTKNRHWGIMVPAKGV
jgi:predicted Zn-dependent peptidase